MISDSELIVSGDFMEVYSLSGRHVANDINQLLSLLKERHNGQFGVLWISPAMYPIMTIGINGEQAWLYFIPDGEHAGFLSQGHLSSGLPDVEFLNDDFQIEMRPVTCVVPLHAAEDASVEFFRTSERPKGVEWLEL